MGGGGGAEERAKAKGGEEEGEEDQEEEEEHQDRYGWWAKDKKRDKDQGEEQGTPRRRVPLAHRRPKSAGILRSRGGITATAWAQLGLDDGGKTSTARTRGLGRGSGLGGSALAARLGWTPSVADTGEETEVVGEVGADEGVAEADAAGSTAALREEEEQQEQEARRRRRRARRRQQQGGAARQTKRARPKKSQLEGSGKSQSQRSRSKHRRSVRRGSDHGGYDSVTSCALLLLLLLSSSWPPPSFQVWLTTHAPPQQTTACFAVSAPAPAVAPAGLAQTPVVLAARARRALRRRRASPQRPARAGRRAPRLGQRERFPSARWTRNSSLGSRALPWSCSKTRTPNTRRTAALSTWRSPTTATMVAAAE